MSKSKKSVVLGVLATLFLACDPEVPAGEPSTPATEDTAPQSVEVSVGPGKELCTVKRQAINAVKVEGYTKKGPGEFTLYRGNQGCTDGIPGQLSPYQRHTGFQFPEILAIRNVTNGWYNYLPYCYRLCVRNPSATTQIIANLGLTAN